MERGGGGGNDPLILGGDAAHPETVETFRSSYPLHPEVLATLTGKTATLGNFQRVRGMLRLLARTIAHLWADRPADATAIHLHHIDPGHGPIRQEIVTRLAQSVYLPAITNDIAGSAEKRSLAQEIDAAQHRGMPPYAVYVARTVFMHTLAFNEPLKGLPPEQLRYSILGPATDISFIDEARKKFIAESAYLDDRPGAPLRFLAEANLIQVIRREELHVDAGDVRAQLNDRIRQVFSGKTLETVSFPSGPFDVADEVGDGQPKLVVMAYDGVSIGGLVETVPEIIGRIFKHKGAEGSALRILRNNVVFVVADESRTEDMRRMTCKRLALQELRKPERLDALVDHQQAKVREFEARSEQELAIAIQQCYRHIFYPSRDHIGDSDVDLAHSAIDAPSTSDQPGAGQQQIVRALRDLNKLRLSEDEPDSPVYVRDRTLLKKGEITTLALRNEFRRDPRLPMLIGDDVFIRGIRLGIEHDEYVYRRGELLFGPGDPPADIMIDEQAIVFTMAYARNTGIWPRKAPGEPEPAESDGGTKTDTGLESEHATATGRKPIGSEPLGTAPDAFTAEGLLNEALISLWEQARARKVESIGTLTIRMFEAGDAFRLLGAVGAVSGAEKTVTITGGYETRDAGSFEFEFRGPVPDSQPVREFLEPQLRDAKSKNIEAGFALMFDDGLPMHGDAADVFTRRLAAFASGAAYVSATAEVKP